MRKSIYLCGLLALSVTMGAAGTASADSRLGAGPVKPGISKEIYKREPKADLIVLPKAPGNTGAMGTGFCEMTTSMKVVFKVKNIGTAKAENGPKYQVAFQNHTVNSPAISPIAKGETRNYVVSIPPGSVQGNIIPFEITIDSQNVVDEKNENNNKASGFCQAPAG